MQIANAEAVLLLSRSLEARSETGFRQAGSEAAMAALTLLLILSILGCSHEGSSPTVQVFAQTVLISLLCIFPASQLPAAELRLPFFGRTFQQALKQPLHLHSQLIQTQL